MNFLIGISNYIIGNLRTDELPFLALDALNEGYDTPSLRILAGLKDDYWEISMYLKSTIKEMNIELPNEKEAGFIVIKSYLQKILNNEVEPIEGLKYIIDNVLRKTDYHEKSKESAYDYIEFSSLYSLYYYYDDMINPLVGVSDEYRQKQIKEIYEEILRESLKYIQNYERIKSKVLDDNNS